MTRKIMDIPGALRWAAERRDGRYPGRGGWFPDRIVAANGCFDLLHVGHVRLLRFAKQQGHALLVAVNSDESVRNRKGISRPVIPAAERSEILAELSDVDAVVLFDEETPAALYEQVRPDVLVKGDDWIGRELPEARWCGRVEFAPRTCDVSTSLLIDRIREETPSVS